MKNERKSLVCPVCNGSAKLVRKDVILEPKGKRILVLQIPTIQCQNPECGEGSYEPKISRAISIAIKAPPMAFVLLPVHRLPKNI